MAAISGFLTQPAKFLILLLIREKVFLDHTLRAWLKHGLMTANGREKTRLDVPQGIGLVTFSAATLIAASLRATR